MKSECQALFFGYSKEKKQANRRPGDGGEPGIGGRGEGRTQNAELSAQRGPWAPLPSAGSGPGRASDAATK